MKVKVESEKVGLKLNIQKTKNMASCPITSWEIDGETVETVSDFIFGGSKITADGDCSHEIKRLLGQANEPNPVSNLQETTGAHSLPKNQFSTPNLDNLFDFERRVIVLHLRMLFL